MKQIAIIGLGKMGGAILNGIVSSNLYKKDEILLVVHREEQKKELRELGYEATLDVKEAYLKAKTLLLAVKPQMFPLVFNESNNFDFTNKCVLSIAAGIKITKLHDMFKNADVVRAMPNTAAFINESVTTICSDNESSISYIEAKKIIASIGKVIDIKEEEMDSTLPLNGSMPAYLYYFIKSFVDAAISSGVSEAKAKELVVNTLISSSKLVLESKDSLDVMINNVCSKGGTTIAGLNKLIENDVDKAIKQCYDACKNRSIELNNS